MTNGTLQYQNKTGGGFDINNDPIAVTVVWSEAIDCWIQTNTHSNKGKYQDGDFTIAAYTVYIDSQPFAADRVKLNNPDGSSLGEFAVQDIQPLEFAGCIKIMVS